MSASPLPRLTARLRRAAITAAWALGAGGAGAAGGPPNVTDGELALLPAYCPDTQGFKYGDQYGSLMSPRAPHWVGLMGKSFWGVHHYCWGLISLHRSQLAGTPRLTRRGLLESAAGDFNYVLTNAAPDFVLMPEILTRYADVQILLGNTPAGYEAYARAWTLRPDYWLPYLQWANLLDKSERRTEARQLLAQALAYSPDAKPIRDRYRQLGGDPAQVQAKPRPAASARHGTETEAAEAGTAPTAAASAASGGAP